jgi:hypothetical protein
VVDAADYTIWRDSLASGTPLLNETASPGEIDGADYDAWKTNFGAMRIPGGAGGQTLVPEPATMVLILCLTASFIAMPKRKRASDHR